jgi:hypothetical protein
MKSFTNHTAGPKGVNLNDGSTHWIEPGETVEIDPDTISGKLPDLGKPSRAADDDDDEAYSVEAAREEVRQAAQTHIDAINAAHAAEIDDLTARAEDAEKALADAQAAPSKPISLSGKDKAKLLAIATLEDVQIEDGAKVDDIKAAIELAREEAAKK